MGRPIDDEKRKKIYKGIDQYHDVYTCSQLARILNVSPATVRHHGDVKGVTFLIKKYSKKIVPVEGKFFVESDRENWLV